MSTPRAGYRCPGPGRPGVPLGACELLDAVVVGGGVEDELIAASGDGDADGVAELTVTASGATPLGEEDARVREFLDPRVEGIDHVDIPDGIDRHVARAGVVQAGSELPVAAARATPLGQEGSGAREFLDADVATIDNEDVSAPVDRDGGGTNELAVSTAVTAPLGEEGTVAREFLNAVIGGVCDVDVSARVHRHAARRKLAIRATQGAPFRNERAAVRELLNTAVARVRDVHIPAPIDRDIARKGELAVLGARRAPLDEEGPGARELLDSAPVAVGDVDLFAGIHRDALCVLELPVR